MKKIFVLLFGLFLSVTMIAQTPDAFNYQAVARDASGTPLVSAGVSVRVSILPGSEVSAAIYSESFSLTTNDFGLFNIQVGNGSVIIGDLGTIDWANGPYFLKVEIVLDDGSGTILIGAAQLLSVPYALHSKSADNVFSGDYGDLDNVPDWSDSIAQAVFSGDYDDLANLPDWEDSIMQAVFSGDYNDLTNLPDWLDSIAEAVFSGDYDDLANLPDWADSIAQAIFSGDYDDLANLPDWADSIMQSVFSGDYNDLTNLPDWSDSIATYTDGAVVPEGVVEVDNMLVYDGTYWVAKDIVMANTGLGQAVNILPPVQVVNFCIALQGVYPSRNIADPFIGTIGIFGFNFAPRGWATCDGQLLSVPSNASLFSLLGTTYGGDGRTSFGLPDLRGRMPMHMGQGPGLSARVLGQKLGSETITISVGQLPAHKHVITYE